MLLLIYYNILKSFRYLIVSPNLIHKQLSYLFILNTQIPHGYSGIAMVVPLAEQLKSGTMIDTLAVTPSLAQGMGTVLPLQVDCLCP